LENNFKGIGGQCPPYINCLTRRTEMIDADATEKILEKIAVIVIPLYKFFVVIVYIGGPLTGIWVLWMTYTNPNTTF
jgi:hypothetical protein